MELLEIEIKYHLDDLKRMREKIVKLGAKSRGRFIETNIRFDDQDNSLMKKKSLLRLRKDNKTTLTLKSRPPLEDDQFKILKELEVGVSDFSTMNQILNDLGYEKKQVYEKFRETFLLGQAVICLDSMPYGDFLEIEAKKNEIKKIAADLELKWDRRIILNYLEIFDIIKDKLGLTFTDMTFINFKGIKVNNREFYHLFYADHPNRT